MKIIDWFKQFFRPAVPSRALNIYKGDGTWCFYAQECVNGDLKLIDSRHYNDALEATWYGGTNDPNDSGRSASGVHTKDHPKLLACALPMDLDRVVDNPCKGSPLPRMKWGTVARSDGSYNVNTLTGTIVRVTNARTGRTLDLPLNDLGPAKSAGNAIDLTQEAYRMLGDGSLRSSLYVRVTILNGMRYMKTP